MIRSIALAGVLSLGATYGALAQSAVFDWTGFYIGVHGGTASGTAEATWAFTLPTTTDDSTFDMQGLIGGAHLGANLQNGAFVFGGEALIDYTNIVGDDAGYGGNINGLEGEWLLTFAGRAGVATDWAFLYASAGAAILQGTSVNFTNSESVPITFVGGTIGGGVEVALSESMTLRLDARQYLFGKTDGPIFPLSNYYESFKPTFTTLTAGVGVKF